MHTASCIRLFTGRPFAQTDARVERTPVVGGRCVREPPMATQRCTLTEKQNAGDSIDPSIDRRFDLG